VTVACSTTSELPGEAGLPSPQTRSSLTAIAAIPAKIGAPMVERIRAFRRSLAHASAERVVPTRHGVALLSDSIPSVYDANYLSVERATAPAQELATEAAAAMEERHHRRVVVEQGGAGVAGDFAELGYSLSTHLVLAHVRELDRRVDTSNVREVSLEELVPARRAGTLAQPWGDAEIARQLDGAKRLIAAAIPTRFFAAFADGEVAAYCEVRSDGQVAQIEDVETLERFRGRGLGRAIVQHALEDARPRHDIVFLEALADDWPRELYRKLGFSVVDRRDFYTRFPHPFSQLRLRTPRLELRVPTVAELRELYAVAAAGIHDPHRMPFAVPWTDDLDESSFLAFHEAQLWSNRPESWDAVLAAFLDGRPVGAQSLRGERFAEMRRVDTGSWLGRTHQGHGLGTEMRAAALTLAFQGLGAEVATSGAIAGNPQSLGVSRKFGYEQVGSHTVAPRGTPVEHADLELHRSRFSSPVAVEVEGLDNVRPLFGVGA
jgi:RimJ/RimL family protein N-acetyltransferase/ribosomal protein S18 acetylase RimI-like enzyme